MFCTIYTGEDAPNQRQPVPRLVSHWRVRFYWSWLTAFCCYLSLYAFNKLSSHAFNKHRHYSGTAWLNQMTENIVKEAMRRRVWLYSTISMETVCIFNICICIFIYSVYIRQSDLWRRRVQLHTIERWKTIAKKIYVLSKNKKRLFLQGIKWHDVACHHEKPIICEDEPGHLRWCCQRFHFRLEVIINFIQVCSGWQIKERLL